MTRRIGKNKKLAYPVQLNRLVLASSRRSGLTGDASSGSGLQIWDGFGLIWPDISGEISLHLRMQSLKVQMVLDVSLIAFTQYLWTERSSATSQ